MAVRTMTKQQHHAVDSLATERRLQHSAAHRRFNAFGRHPPTPTATPKPPPPAAAASYVPVKSMAPNSQPIATVAAKAAWMQLSLDSELRLQAAACRRREVKPMVARTSQEKASVSVSGLSKQQVHAEESLSTEQRLQKAAAARRAFKPAAEAAKSEGAQPGIHEVASVSLMMALIGACEDVVVHFKANW